MQAWAPGHVSLSTRAGVRTGRQTAKGQIILLQTGTGLTEATSEATWFIHTICWGSNPPTLRCLWWGLFSLLRLCKIHSARRPLLLVLMLLVLILLPFVIPDSSRCLKGNQSKCRITPLHPLHHLDLTPILLHVAVSHCQISNMSVMHREMTESSTGFFFSPPLALCQPLPALSLPSSPWKLAMPQEKQEQLQDLGSPLWSPFSQGPLSPGPYSHLG